MRPGGFLEIVVAVPGELVEEAGAAPPGTSRSGAAPSRVGWSGAGRGDRSAPGPAGPSPWPAGRSGPGPAGGPAGPSPAGPPWSPGTWDNPGFVVGYAHARAVAVRRWAAELGVAGGFRPELLTDRRDRAVLRSLAEAPGRRASRDPGWAAYAERLALAYHDAFERAPALPRGDEEASALHVARVRLAGAVRETLAEAMGAVGVVPPDRL
ncbi:anticodon-binding protein [Planomonospora sp. ID82291]|nr:anticodon-binding protein [Planomonospora sp. ID82291]